MAQVETAYEHIVLTGDGTLVIEGANTKVIEVVLVSTSQPPRYARERVAKG